MIWRVPITLVAILICPPTTSGAITKTRIEAFCRILEFDNYQIVNLLNKPSYRSSSISENGSNLQDWLDSRQEIIEALSISSAVLLGYGISPPSGMAGKHFKLQTEWLHTALDEFEVVQYFVGEGPRHPSRWQRFTARNFPEIPFLDALKLSIKSNT